MNILEALLLGAILGALTVLVLNATLNHKAEVKALMEDLARLRKDVADHDVSLAKQDGRHALHDLRIATLGEADAPMPKLAPKYEERASDVKYVPPGYVPADTFETGTPVSPDKTPITGDSPST